MAPNRRRPPTRDRRHFGNVLLGQRLDTLEDSPSQPIRQDRPRRLPRKCASRPRPLGPGERAALEARIEQLAYGEVLPDDLSEVRAVWWNLARQGVRLPAQPGALLIHGGVDG